MRQAGRPVPGGVLIERTLTRQEFAELTGTTLYTVSRILSKWQADGILAASGRRLVVCSRARLEELSQHGED
jgi:CRP-like cAMP-binding protein